jgi:hypothetical protein
METRSLWAAPGPIGGRTSAEVSAARKHASASKIPSQGRDESLPSLLIQPL